MGALTLNPSEDNLYSAVIDSAGRYAYFGTDSSPGYLVKIDLSSFTVASALSPGESNFVSAVIDSAEGFAYFGTDNGPANNSIVKIRLSNFTVVGTLETDSLGLSSAVIDPGTGYAYFGTDTSPGAPGEVLKINLTTFTVATVLVLSHDEDDLSTAVIDAAGGYAYFGNLGHTPISQPPGIVVRIRLSDFTQAGNLTLSQCCMVSSMIDSAGGYAYFGTGGATVDRISLSNFTLAGTLATPSRVSITSAVINSTEGYAWFGTKFNNPAEIFTIRLADFAMVNSLTMNTGESNLGPAVIDPAGAYAYFGTATSPGIVLKVKVGETVVSCVPSPPLGLGADYISSKVVLSWVAPVSIGCPSITGYNVYGGTCGGGKMLLARLGVQLSYNDTHFVANTMRCYTATALNEFGESSPSSPAQVYIPVPRFPPPAPPRTPPPRDVIISGDPNFPPEVIPNSWPNTTICKDTSATFPNATDLTFNIVVNASAGNPLTIIIYGMNETKPNFWCVDVTELFPLHGPADVYISLIAANGTVVYEKWPEYIDPSGFIKDSRTGFPIPGATVTLEACNRPSGSCGTPSPGSYIPSIDPEITDSLGAYDWNVTAGYWRVDATASGYNPGDSPVFHIPPELTNFNVTLTPVNVTVVFNESPIGGGTIECADQTFSSGQTGQFSENSLLTCKATPASNYQFSSWSGLSSGSTNPTTFNVTSGGTLTAIFAAIPKPPIPNFSITVNPDSVRVADGSTGTSSITISPLNGFSSTVTLSIQNAGIACTLSTSTITGGTGSSTVSCSGSPGEYTVTVTATSGEISHSVPAYFSVTATSRITILEVLLYGSIGGVVVGSIIGGIVALGRKRSENRANL